jgi:uroporphyrinogen III methyltransferase/synthase
LERLSRKEIDLVTFTSSSTVWNFVEAIPNHRRTEILRSIKCVTIGPITSQAAKEAGIEVVTEADEYTIPGLVEAILRLPHPASS